MTRFLTLLIIALILSLPTISARGENITLDPVCQDKTYAKAAEIADLVAQLRGFDGDMSGKGSFMAYPLLAHLNNVVNDTGTIETFRCNDDLAVIQKLIAMASTEDRTIRVNASRLLANVADNTTLCGVIDALAGDTLNDDTRYNLWQVVYVVSGYARKENKAWIQSLIAQQEPRLINGDYGRILRIIERTKTALAGNDRTASLSETYGPSYNDCLQLKSLAAMTRQF